MLAQVLQIFFGKELHAKNWLISTQGNLLQRNNFFSSVQNLSSLHKIGWRLSEKNSPFFKHASSSVAPRISMGSTLRADFFGFDE
jgi:hypothetical protein